MNRKGTFIFALAGAAILLLIILNIRQEKREASAEVFAMDTVMSLKAYGKNAEKAVSEASAEIKRLESLFSVNIPQSDISAINSQKTAAVSPDTYGLIKAACSYGEKTDGCLDPAIFPAVKKWGFTTGEYNIPTESELDVLKAHTDPTTINFDDKSMTVSLDDDMSELDLGAVAKGYASDRVIEIFRKNGIESGIISLGGNVAALGKKPDGSLWRVAVQDPKNSEKYVGIIETENRAVVTSGDYQRYFEKDGKRFHHIIDPKTCMPADSGLSSVTVAASEGLEADALSTAFFIMGKDRAIDYIKNSPEPIGALFIEKSGKISVTQDLEESFLPGDGINISEIIETKNAE